MGGKREYTAIFSIGGRLLGSFRGAMAAAGNRLRGLSRIARSAFGLIKSALGGMLVGFGSFLAANVLAKMFSGASEEAIEAEQRTRALTNALMLNNKVAKGGTAEAKKQLDLIYQHNQRLEEQGVLHKDILDNMAVQLALKGGIPPGAISDSIDVMQDLLVATKGVTASEEDGTSMAKAWANAVARGRLMGLANQGVAITKEQTKAFAKLKTVQERQLWLMKNIGMRYRGVAAAARETPVGRIVQFRNAIKSLSEEIGQVLLPAQADMADAWRAMLEDPAIRGMLIRSVQGLGKAVSVTANIIKDDLIPMLKAVGESEAFKKMAGWAKSAFTHTKKLLDLMGLAAKVGAPYDVTAAATRKNYAGLPGPYMPEIPAAEKQLAPMRDLTGLDLFKPAVVEQAKDFNMITDKLPSSLAPSTAAMNDLKAAAQDVGMMAAVTIPELINMAESATNLADSVAAADDWFTRLDRTLAEFAGSIPLIGAHLQGAVPNTKPVTMPTGPGFVPTYQHGGIIDKPTLALMGERGPEAVVPLRPGGGGGAGIGGDTTVHFAPHITVNGNADAADIESRVRSVARDFVDNFKRAQTHERRLSYESGYS